MDIVLFIKASFTFRIFVLALRTFVGKFLIPIQKSDCTVESTLFPHNLIKPLIQATKTHFKEKVHRF